jgi:hypothetical protein
VNGTIGANFFLDETDCRFLRAAQLDTACPANYHQTFVKGTNNFTLIGCTDTASFCYSQNIVNQLKSFGYDISKLPVCPQK